MLERTWAQGGERDVYVDYNALTLDITLAALFGQSQGAGSSSSGAESQQIVAYVEKAFEFFTRR